MSSPIANAEIDPFLLLEPIAIEFALVAFAAIPIAIAPLPIAPAVAPYFPRLSLSSLVPSLFT